jgi:D-alanyl-lipoteichoic acid acyltransferase DltB (MBOAT superfamily)
MLFHTAAFGWFLLVLIPAVFALPRVAVMWALLLASYVFYGFSGPWYVLLLMATSLVDYALARAFEGRPARWRHVGIAVSAISNFSVLGFFKYSNFVFSNLNPVLHAMAIPAQLPVLEILLPVGVSFYTFQSFAYTVEVLTGRYPACRTLPRFLLFVSWFPQLVAGPIMRAPDLLPQVEKVEDKLRGMAARVPAAATLFAEGWLRKAFADLVSPTADAFFADPGSATGAAALFGVVAFGLQIYGDFSGYTRMAQGTSWLFGIRLMENFDLPYTARSVREFWRRWHISLSTWFRDYVYIPLGGNRRGPARTYFNLVLTMLLCGLWHGANWTFLLWGAMHAAAMVTERALEPTGARIPDAMGRVLTVAFVFLAWVPFRAPDVHSALAAYGALAHGGREWPALAFVIGAAGLVAVDVYTRYAGRRAFGTLRDEAAAASAFGEWKAATLLGVCALIGATAHVLGHTKVSSFIYFQF